ncbi:MAG: hypothetical protein H0T76_02430 [Nannocystis sp.]|nr:hypothetical protein [Nannocystis sp.]MBA3545318.1 hypothetical protein [Nannocystis sp.]
MKILRGHHSGISRSPEPPITAFSEAMGKLAHGPDDVITALERRHRGDPDPSAHASAGSSIEAAGDCHLRSLRTQQRPQMPTHGFRHAAGCGMRIVISIARKIGDSCDRADASVGEKPS